MLEVGADVKLTDAGEMVEEELNGRTVEATLPLEETSSSFELSEGWEMLGVAEALADWPSLPADWTGDCMREEEVVDSPAEDAEEGPPIVVG